MLGQTVGHYRVTERIGGGGMGEVFRAQDVRLGRSVAVKFLPAEVGKNPAALERFQREARAASALNHPNICTVYDLGEHLGRPYLVMEFLEGTTIEQAIGGHPLSMDLLLDAATQAAEALAAAHAKGIVHRDIKPSNLFLTRAGHLKVLDFGLAKLTEGENSPSPASSIPTREKDHLTSPGVAVGTVAYMSPEQALGKELDARTDIFSIGVVVYEMATGRRPFSGGTTAAVFDSILHKTPTAPVRLNPEVPIRLEEIIHRTLEKDPGLRYQSVSDLGADLKRLRRDAASDRSAGSEIKVWRESRFWAPWALTVLACGAALWALLRPAASPPRPVTRFSIHFSPEESLTSFELDDPVVALSPDGSHLVYLAGRKLHLRVMDHEDATAIPGTEGAWSGFFSADGQWVGFYSSDGKLKKVHTGGGTPVTLCDAPNVWGASWAEDDTILFTTTGNSGLARLPASGGSPSFVTTPDANEGELSHRWPEFLPGGEAALFTIWKGSFQDSQIALLLLETGEHRVLLTGGSNPRFSSTGHIVYAREGQLMAAPFDLGRLDLLGEPLPVLDRVATQGWTGAAHFSLSDDGDLAYIQRTGAPQRALMWVDRKGSSRLITETRRGYMGPRLSPDGRLLSLMIQDDIAVHVWLYDLERDALTRLSSGVGGSTPIWTPDGKRIAFQSGTEIVWQAADGSGGAEALARGTEAPVPISWSPDGSVLVFNNHDAASRSDIWLVSPKGDGKPRAFLQTPAVELGGVLSPDGRFIAYVSNASGRFEVYVQPFPGPGFRSQVSTEGGTNPVWARSGRELFYRSEDKMMAVTVETEPALRLSKPTLLFEERFLQEAEGVVGFAQYDVAPDGEHFVMIRDESLVSRIHVVLNWAEELKQQVPIRQR